MTYEGGRRGAARRHRTRMGLYAIVMILVILCADITYKMGEDEPATDSESELDPDITKLSESMLTRKGVYSVVDEMVINCWGDSMTEGVNGDGISYPEVLEDLTGIKTNNFGVAGENTLQIMERSAEYGDQSNDIMIIEMGDNGGWESLPELIEQYQEMIDAAGCERYIIITSTDDPDDPESIWYEETPCLGIDNTSYEQALLDAFGDHVFLARRYLLINGLKLNGIEAEKEDYRRAFNGDISLKLRHSEIDNTHLNGLGYIAQAIGVYAKGVELGYWQDTGIDTGFVTTEEMLSNFFA
ncbi:MAG: SGNH/GDSL hydrolase family protein [Lachnospiraceae bacterium]|jgi:hypothetical protein